jgi:hypothetical protein
VSFDFDVSANLGGEGFTQSLLDHFVGFSIDSDLGKRIGTFSMLISDSLGTQSNLLSLDTLDEMSGISCNFIPEGFGGNLGDFAEDFFIDVEVVGQLDVVFFEEHLSSSFDGFCSDSAH